MSILGVFLAEGRSVSRAAWIPHMCSLNSIFSIHLDSELWGIDKGGGKGLGTKTTPCWGGFPGQGYTFDISNVKFISRTTEKSQFLTNEMTKIWLKHVMLWKDCKNISLYIISSMIHVKDITTFLSATMSYCLLLILVKEHPCMSDFILLT